MNTNHIYLYDISLLLLISYTYENNVQYKKSPDPFHRKRTILEVWLQKSHHRRNLQSSRGK